MKNEKKNENLIKNKMVEKQMYAYNNDTKNVENINNNNDNANNN